MSGEDIRPDLREDAEAPAYRTESADEHVFHMWEPLKFETKAGYDYCRKAWYLRALTAVVRTFAFVVLQIYERLFLGYRVVGRENLKPLRRKGAVTVCNHVHPLDCTMVDLALYPKRTYYLTLESNFRIPGIRHLIRVLGGVPLPRQPKRMLEMFRAMGEAADNGAVVHIYPEGVLIPYCETLRPFKNGAFRFVAQKQLPVVPMVITQRQPNGLYRLFKRKPCLTLNILPVQMPDGAMKPKAAAAALASECRIAMQHRMDLCRKNESKGGLTA